MWRKVLATVLIGMGSVVVVAMIDVVQDYRPDDPIREAVTIMMVVLGFVPAAMFFAAWALLRSANRRPTPPSIGWMPTGPQWLSQQMWRELPDLVPNRPQNRPRPMPAVGVPPDEALRKLWAARAEIAHDRRRPLGWLPVGGWIGLAAFVPLVILLMALITTTVLFGPRTETLDVTLLFMDWVLCLVAASWLSVYRPLARYRRLVQIERELSHAMRGRTDTGAPLPATGLVELVTDPVTGWQGYYHPQLLRVRSYAAA